MAALSVVCKVYERALSTRQHLIWFTLEWIRLLLKWPQFQKIVEPICEHFFTRNRKLYAFIKILQRVTKAREGALIFKRPSSFSSTLDVAPVISVCGLLRITVLSKTRVEWFAPVGVHILFRCFLCVVHTSLTLMCIYCKC